MMNDTAIKEQIKRDEGRPKSVYLDSEGYATGGYGHRCYDLAAGTVVSETQAIEWLNADYATAVRDYNSLGFNLDPVRRAVLIMMCFNLGLTRLLGFKRFLGCIRGKDYVMAGKEMLDSKWRRQVKDRAHRMAAAMITGLWI